MRGSGSRLRVGTSHERSYTTSVWLAAVCGGVDQPPCAGGACQLGLARAPDDERCSPAWGEGTRWFRHEDGDGRGDVRHFSVGCSQPEGYVNDDSDCDDTRASIYRGAAVTHGYVRRP